jgi:hypothetical protein
MYVINIIYKVCLNSFGVVLNLFEIFCLKILQKMEKIREKKSALFTKALV